MPAQPAPTTSTSCFAITGNDASARERSDARRTVLHGRKRGSRPLPRLANVERGDPARLRRGNGGVLGRGLGVPEATRRAYGGDIGEFCGWLEDRGTRLDAVDVRVLAVYVTWLGGARGGRKLAPATISRKLAAVRAFLRHALGPERVPDARLGPRRPRPLPDAPAAAEIERMLEALEGDGPVALRNRALVELVYSAGLRSAEAVGLDLGDVGFEQEL